MLKGHHPSSLSGLDLCRCNSCSQTQINDRITQQLIFGKYITPALRREHERNDRDVKIAQALFNEENDAGMDASGTHFDVQQIDSMLSYLSTVNDRRPSVASSPVPTPTPLSQQHPSVDHSADFRKIITDRLRSISERVENTVLASLVKDKTLLFVQPPSLSFHAPLQDTLLRTCSPNLELCEDYPQNAALMREELWTKSALDFLQGDYDLYLLDATTQNYRDDLSRSLLRREEELHHLKSDIWNHQMYELKLSRRPRAHIVDTGSHLSKPFLRWHPTVLTCYILVATCYLVLNLSLSSTNVVLMSIKHLIRMMEASRPDPNVPIHGVTSGIPATTETVLAQLSLSPKFRSYVTCPRCFKLYPPSEDGTYPETCFSKSTPESQPCKSTLRKQFRNADGSISQRPVRLYLHHELEDWIARLYARKDIEEALDRDLRHAGSADDVIWDICDSPGIQSFIGPDGMPFIRKPERVGRLLFSINMDGLNPYGNKEAGKKASIGAIYMVCLNLPVNLRYNVENMFLVGVIPGPAEPSKDQINYVLEPLVDDLLVIWETGFYLSATHRYPTGRFVEGAAIPLISDLPASRQMSGFAGHASENFCSFCLLKGKDMNNFDYRSWPRRSREEHLSIAHRWRDAETADQRQEIYDQTGVRWSELLRLPYWDPTRFVVIDVMHALLLGLIRHHFRKIWGMDAKIDDTDCQYIPPVPQNVSALKLAVAKQALENYDYNTLASCRRLELSQLSRDYGLPFGGRKKTIYAGLVNYRESQRRLLEPQSRSSVTDVLFDKVSEEEDEDEGTNEAEDEEEQEPEVEEEEEESGDIPIASSSATRIKPVILIGRRTLNDIKVDMGKISLPGWVGAAPKNPGESKTGKFTADQWRTFSTINAVVTLNRIWAGHSPGQVDPEMERKQSMLTNFMHLVTAVKIGLMRTTSSKRIEEYTHHMHSYLSTLQTLYPWAGITPYHHISLHLPEMLRRFGPSSGWRCFVFERYNHLLQSTSTNSKFGDLERTIFQKFCRGQNLHMLISVEGMPEALYPLVKDWKEGVFAQKSSKATIRDEGVLYDEYEEQELSVKDMEILPDLWLKCLQDWTAHHESDNDITYLSRYAQILRQIKRRDETFSVHNYHPRNSWVYYRQSNGDLCAGSITAIFLHQRERVELDSDERHRVDTFFVLRQLKCLPEHLVHLDYYRKFDFTAGRLYLHEWYESLSVVLLKDILYHFAAYPSQLSNGEQVMLALPLNKW